MPHVWTSQQKAQALASCFVSGDVHYLAPHKTKHM